MKRKKIKLLEYLLLRTCIFSIPAFAGATIYLAIFNRHGLLSVPYLSLALFAIVSVGLFEMIKSKSISLKKSLSKCDNSCTSELDDSMSYSEMLIRNSTDNFPALKNEIYRSIMLGAPLQNITAYRFAFEQGWESKSPGGFYESLRLYQLENTSHLEEVENRVKSLIEGFKNP